MALIYEEIEKYLKEHHVAGSTLYVGCDSEVVSATPGGIKASYTTVIVIHLQNKNGCKIFHDIETKTIHGGDRKSLIGNRLRHEYLMAAEVANSIGIPLAIEYDLELEIHLDLNPNPNNRSSIVVNEALGYVQGVCNVMPKIKPDAPIASTCADMYRAKLSKYGKPKIISA